VTILSTFYDTSAGVPASLVTEVKWAKAHPHIGSSAYGVVGATDLKVTAHPTTPYTVNVAPGSAWGHGVFDESDQTVTVTCAVPDAGTTRWDLICVRRDWGPAAGGPTTITSVEGGTVKTIPAARNNTPGTLDDQPLQLVQWTAGQTQPTAMVDLRCWGGDGGLYAADDLARSYLTRLGTEVNIAGTVWAYTVGANDTPTWVKAGEVGKIGLFGYGSALDGNPGAGKENFLVQAGTIVSDTDNSGYARITFPKPFPNGLLSIVLTNGDSSVDRQYGHVLVMSVSGAPWNTGTRTDVVYSVFLEDSAGTHRLYAAANTRHRVDYIAIGW
jgi:hypothetical protein